MKLTILVTADPCRETERCAMSLAIAGTAIAAGGEVAIFFALDGVRTCQRNALDGLVAGAFPAPKSLLDAYLEAGGKVFVCEPSMRARCIGKEHLIEHVGIVSAMSLVASLSGGQLLSL